MDTPDETGKRIVLFMRSLNAGGAERVMLDFARGLADAGEHVGLVVLDDSGPYRTLVPDDVPLVVLGRSRLLTALPALARHLRRRAPAVLLSTGTHANVVAVAAASLAGRTVDVVIREANTARVSAEHGTTLKDRVLPALERAAYRRSDRVLANSHGLADELRARLGPRHAHRVAVLPNPVDVDAIREQAAAPSPHAWLDDDAPVILSVARFAPQKDHETLLRAFAQLRESRPDARLILLGEGPLRDDLAALADDLDLTEHVAMPGIDPNPFRWIARADVLALTSRWEGLANVLLQAIACGTPAVATDCPHGPAETAARTDLITLVPVGDVSAIAQALEGWLERDQQSRSPSVAPQALADLAPHRLRGDLQALLRS